ncbi:hypothetical protein BGZ60DRAFT_424785 [Tricladium varicosporioides]|nr:hypothetical protein BGZ60DRAFT_424785 [Hymenoscyphus varicosporioides]
MGSDTGEARLLRRNAALLPSTAISDLKSAVKCQVVVKGEAPEDIYRAAIHRFNNAVVEEAEIVVFCQSEADVAAVLKYAQTWKLDFTIACGGHSYYGASSTKSLVLDLSKMNKVTIDKDTMTITAQGGCRAIDLETPLQVEGLSVVMGAANDTGIGGLTLGGGSGFLSGQHGLVIDNLVAAKVVIANGDALVCSETENQDLFWGIRGGGSNFGVVIEFTYRIHEQGDVFFGPLVFTPDKIEPVLGLLTNLQAIVDEAGGRLAIFVALGKGPGMPSAHPIILIFYDGTEEEARKLTASIWDLEPIVSMAKMQPYADITKPSDLTNGPPSHQYYAPSNALMYTPPDTEVIQTLINDFDAFMTKYGAAVAPSKIAMELRSYKKSSSVSPTATALAARRPAVMTVVEAQFDNSVDAELMRQEVSAMISKVREATRKEGLTKGGAEFLNANIAEKNEKVQNMFGENLPRLREVKRKYDPDFIFDKWYPIPPA